MQGKYIASCSFGKDSMATILLALKHGEPLDGAVYCELMFDQKTSGEIPEHKEFIDQTALPFMEKIGIPVTMIRPEKTLKDFFYHKRGEKSKYCGKMVGFPMVGRCELNGQAKVKAIKAYWKKQPPNSVQYIGIAADEPKRLARMKSNSISLLEKYKVTEAAAFEICKRAGMLSPIYDFTTRNGCFFCPNAQENELRHLRKFHPELWRQLLQMSKTENLIKNNFKVDKSLQDFEDQFAFEDMQISFF